MDRKVTQTKKTQRSPRDHTTKYDSGTQSPGSSMDGRTTSMTATSYLNRPWKRRRRRRRRRVEEELRITVLKKTVWKFGKQLRLQTKKRKMDRTVYESASSSEDSDTESSSSTWAGKRTGKRTGKRKTAAEDDKGPSRERTGKRTGKRKTTAEDDEGPSRKRTCKRKTAANDDEGPSRERTVKRKTAAEDDEGPSRERTCKRKTAANDDEGPSRERTVKRKTAAEDDEGPSRKRRRTTADQTDNKAKTRQEAAEDARAEFEAKYKQQNQLGAGGCGSVFAGYRRADRLPVAIKHIQRDKIYCTQVDKRGQQLSVEVAIMLKMANGTTGSVGTSAPVSLLDWYDLDQELILVLERPVPCKDLRDYINENRGSLREEEAKIILKQLVDAVKDLQDHCIFHRDIKAENILIETSSDVPRVRIIDFGLGCFFKKRSSFRVFFGTSAHVPPEWVSRSTYRAGPTTVWQLGVVLFDSLHRKQTFNTTKFMKHQLKIKKSLSEDCLDFLRLCLTKVPERRPTLQDLQQHPWLR